MLTGGILHTGIMYVLEGGGWGEMNKNLVSEMSTLANPTYSGSSILVLTNSSVSN